MLFTLESVFVSVIAWVILRNRPRPVEALALVRRPGQHRLGFTQPDHGPLAHRAANLVHVLIMEDREEPRPQVGALLPQMQLPQGAGKAILNQIVRRHDIAREGASVAPQARNLGLDAPMDVRHENPSRSPRPAYRPIRSGPDSIGGAVIG
jgi:hypothetical protein